MSAMSAPQSGETSLLMNSRSESQGDMTAGSPAPRYSVSSPRGEAAIRTNPIRPIATPRASSIVTPPQSRLRDPYTMPSPMKTSPMSMARRGRMIMNVVLRRSEQVERREERDPDDVHEMPVDRGRLHRVVVLGRELPGHAAVEHDAQHDRTTQHVRAMEAGHRVEGAPERRVGLSLIHISEPRDGLLSRMPSSA